MKHLLRFLKDDNDVTLALTVGSPSADRRDTTQNNRFLSVKSSQSTIIVNYQKFIWAHNVFKSKNYQQLPEFKISQPLSTITSYLRKIKTGSTIINNYQQFAKGQNWGNHYQPLSTISSNLSLIVFICSAFICVKAKRRLPASFNEAPIK